MSKKLKLFPGRMSRELFRLASMAISFLFTCFVYATDHIVTAGGKSSAITKMQSMLPVFDSENEAISSQYSVKGTILSRIDSSAVRNAIVTLRDTAAKLVVDSTTTNTDGTFFMTFSESGQIPKTWLLDVRYNYFFSKDTLISIPADDTVSVKLFLNSSVPVYGCPPASAKSGIANLSAQAWQENETIEMRYSLSAPEQTRLALFGANGRLVKEYFGRRVQAGEHEAHIEISGLSVGIYFLVLQAGMQAAITKIAVGMR
jgi:hypothetical protein